MENRQKLLSSIVCYIDGAITLEDLENWYVPKLEDLVNNPKTIYIVSALELELVDFQDRLITEEEMKNNLKSIVELGNKYELDIK